MPVVSVRRFVSTPAAHPTTVEILIADADEATNATVWIRAKFQFAVRGDQKHSLLVLEALDRLQSLVEQGRENAALPYGQSS
jgi:hypothetical protein